MCFYSFTGNSFELMRGEYGFLASQVPRVPTVLLDNRPWSLLVVQICLHCSLMPGGSHTEYLTVLCGVRHNVLGKRLCNTDR